MSLVDNFNITRLMFSNNNNCKSDKKLIKEVLGPTCIDDLDKVYSEYAVQMEHSYSRDCRPLDGSSTNTRTLMIHKPPQCPSCHVHPVDDGVELDEANHPPIPSYNETAAKESMNECSRVASNVRNSNSDDKDWEENVNKSTWLPFQDKLFMKIVRLLDLDHLARLATIGRQHEPIQRRVIIDKSVQRMRQALASVSWEPRWTQWLHGVLMEHLPPSYMASYLDILQTLKTKLPSLMDKMMFGRPMNVNQDLLAPVLKKQWDPIVSPKSRKLPGSSIILVIPSVPVSSGNPSRIQKWLQLFSTMTQVIQVTNTNCAGTSLNKQSVDQVAEHLVSMSRIKIQELRNEQPTRQIILVGFNAGAALALQIALVEAVTCVVCMGFSYNTINGVRGAPDDHILDITVPVMFVIGQNSARTSQEEMEALREKMQCETNLVVVGSADDVLRVPKNKRQIEGVTQSMVDSMITDEVQEFVRNCIVNPPRPRQPNSSVSVATTVNSPSQIRRVTAAPTLSTATTTASTTPIVARKRRVSQGSDSEGVAGVSKSKLVKAGSIVRPKPRTAVTKQTLLPQPSTEVLNMAIQSILPEPEKTTVKADIKEEDQIMSTYEIITQPKLDIRQTGQTTLSAISGSTILPMIQRPVGGGTLGSTQKIKMISQPQFVQLKQGNQQQKIYTIKASSVGTNVTASSSRGENFKAGPIFTIKSSPSTTQFVQTSGIQNQVILNPQKFTVLKSGTTIVGSSNSDPNKVTAVQSDLSNIFDMPIIFADNDGNLHDTAPITSVAAHSSGNSIIITQAQKPKTTTTTTNKVVYINRGSIKPVPNIISKSVPPLKYTKVMVTNPKAANQNIISRPGLDAEKALNAITIQKPKSASETATTSSAKSITVTTQQQTLTASSSAGGKQFQPIIINVDSDKAMKNVIKVGETQIKPTILFKGGLKQIPVLKSGILNRNVTVRKVVNIVPATKKQGEHSKTIVVTTAAPSSSIHQIVNVSSSNKIDKD